MMAYTLMPRIRKWQDLKLYRPAPGTTYEHIDALFAEEAIDWELIRKHLPDMFRMALSIKAGRFTPSTVLRTMSAPSRNKVAQAYREWGRVQRTIFLLRYIKDPELRATISKETNRSEQFNALLAWVAFGSAGVIRENNRAEQRKAIKYTVLVANALIFHNTVVITNQLRALIRAGQHIDPALVAALSPYIHKYPDRFGYFDLDLTNPPDPVDYDTPVVSPLPTGVPAEG